MKHLLAMVVTGAQLCAAGPAEFGWAQLRKAAEERGIAARYLPLEADVSSTLKAESFEIQPARISGGDLRGVMYGLLEAAEQIRATGKVVKTKSEPVVLLRGVRLELEPAVFAEDWFHSRAFWSSYFAGLAQARINRLQLEFAHPPFPYLMRLPLFDGVSVENLTPFERGRNLDAIKQIAALAIDFAVDLAVGIRSFETPAGVAGLTADRRVPYLRSALETMLADVHAIRALAVQAPPDLTEPIATAITSVGRLVTIESQGNPFHANWRAVQELAPHEAMPPVASLTAGKTAVLRKVAKSRFADPQYARLAARCVALGATGIEVVVKPSFTEPDARMTHFVWGRLSYDPAAADSVWRAHPLDEAMASASRTYPRQPSETELQAVQRLHWNASQMERALHGQAASPLADALRAAAEQARYDGRLMWGEFLVANHRKTGHEIFLQAALRELRAARTLAEKLKLPTAKLDEQIGSIVSMLPKESHVETALPWTPPPPRPNAVHRPFLQADSRKPLAVPVILPPGSPLTEIRLRYRMLEQAGEFQTLEAPARAPRFTIPASALAAPGTLLYYFELRNPEGVWLYPDPAVEPPVFQTRIRDEVVKKAP